MKRTEIAGIPAGIVNNHNEVLYYWVKSGIRNAILFRVDAHHDMMDSCPYKSSFCSPQGDLTTDSYHHFLMDNFNCPAVYHRIVNSIYWLNPHSEERKLQDLGAAREETGRRRISVTVNKRLSNYDDGPLYIWNNEEISSGIGQVIISPAEIKIPEGSPLIADFDLDGFCCDKNIHQVPDGYDGVSNFEKRIDASITILKLLPKPDLITIARSQGDGLIGCYVPADKVDVVQECLIARLRDIYRK